MPNRNPSGINLNRLPLSPPIVLSFAASDPSGGAGIQADLMTLSAMGCHALSVITALTVQDTVGVDSVLAIDSDWVEDQARALLEDMHISAFKIGLLGSVENIAVIAEILADYPDVPLVLDPVLASGRGDAFADEEMISALRELLLPQTTVLTPNSIEARRLSNENEDCEEALPLIECAHRLLGFGCEYVLVTGTHETTTQVLNSLYDGEGLVRCDAWDRLPGSYHGSGCTLASAIAASLARGLPVPDAVFDAQDYTWQALAAGFRPGMGQYIPDRFFWARAVGELGDA
jgi:hydroxymethylpyrimidine/phosphomethylpyrimidine kinase